VEHFCTAGGKHYTRAAPRKGQRGRTTNATGGAVMATTARSV
jgi:hypothetical protein